MNKKDDKYIFSAFFARLTGFHLFNCSTALFEKNTVPTIGAPDINVYLNFLFAPCAFVQY